MKYIMCIPRKRPENILQKENLFMGSSQAGETLGRKKWRVRKMHLLAPGKWNREESGEKLLSLGSWPEWLAGLLVSESEPSPGTGLIHTFHAESHPRKMRCWSFWFAALPFFEVIRFLFRLRMTFNCLCLTTATQLFRWIYSLWTRSDALLHFVLLGRLWPQTPDRVLWF